jgi:hypothetical protein
MLWDKLGMAFRNAINALYETNYVKKVSEFEDIRRQLQF